MVAVVVAACVEGVGVVDEVDDDDGEFVVAVAVAVAENEVELCGNVAPAVAVVVVDGEAAPPTLSALNAAVPNVPDAAVVVSRDNASDPSPFPPCSSPSTASPSPFPFR